MIFNVIGAGFRETPIEIREKLSVDGDLYGVVCQVLKANCGIKDVSVISTCNRIEIYYTLPEDQIEADSKSNSDHKDTGVIQAFLSVVGVSEDIVRYFYHHRDKAAIRHLFSVTAALDSLVVGEPQITGQVKDGFRRSCELSPVSGFMRRIFEEAFRVAKKIRQETDIGRTGVSVSYVVAELAKKILDNLHDRTVLVIGSGEMAELAVMNLMRNGVTKIRIANRTFENACSLAEKYRASVVRFEHIADALTDADMVISSTGSRNYIITAEMVKQAVRGRRKSPLFMIDIALPRDIEATANELDNVFLYNVDDLQQIANENMGNRLREAQKASQIVEQETDLVMRRLNFREMTPLINALRAKLENTVRESITDKIISSPDFTDSQKQIIKRASGAVVNKLLHTHIRQIRTMHAEGKDPVPVLAEMFDLNLDDFAGQHADNSEVVTHDNPRLAVCQTDIIIRYISRLYPDIQCEKILLKTTGDKILDKALSDIGGKGLFLKELEEALMSGEADIAVHSVKDVPAVLYPGLELGAVIPEDSPLDAFISDDYASFAGMPAGTKVGTSSQRRTAQLRILRPDIEFVPLRGNLDTRLRKMREKQTDAVILAAAGMERLGMQSHIRHKFSAEQCIPAVSQGIIGIEFRTGDQNIRKLLDKLNSPPTFRRMQLERCFKDRADADCKTPAACYLETKPDGYECYMFLADTAMTQWTKHREFLKFGGENLEERISAIADKMMTVLANRQGHPF
ncbi:hypothetical protein CHS0354_002071 [Potamilus streckersoni]|uniref:Glutamyl-tRNA reductase n=1 Tax=Potamilus streckersoni TaxID=2493646 RepID=A0AAE0T6A1_9BIVA|nr:hypothetical protein CHS0354_002071 [Potamilus streckersoni]